MGVAPFNIYHRRTVFFHSSEPFFDEKRHTMVLIRDRMLGIDRQHSSCAFNKNSSSLNWQNVQNLFQVLQRQEAVFTKVLRYSLVGDGIAAVGAIVVYALGVHGGRALFSLWELMAFLFFLAGQVCWFYFYVEYLRSRLVMVTDAARETGTVSL